VAKARKVKEERLEDILFACRNHLRGMFIQCAKLVEAHGGNTKIYRDWQQKKIGAKPELYYSAAKKELAVRQAVNAKRLTAACEALGVKTENDHAV